MTDVFISFRGDNGIGGAIAGLIDRTLHEKYRLNCYMSSVVLDGIGTDNYREKEDIAIEEANVAIIILTSNYFIGCDKLEDEVRYELKKIFERDNLKKVVIAASDFNWNEVDFDVLSQIIGKDNSDGFRHINYIDYIAYNGVRQFYGTEVRLAEALNLDPKVITSSTEDEIRLFSFLRDNLDDRQKHNGSYHLDKICEELFPGIREIQRDIVQNGQSKGKDIELSSFIINNRKSDYLITGNGGIGKTVLLLNTCRVLLDARIPALYIPLNDCFNNSVEASAFYDKDIEDSFFSSPYGVLLLDGFNEVADADKQNILSSIKSLAMRTNIQIVLSSRYDPRQFDVTFSGFNTISLAPLSHKQIDDYLVMCGLKPDIVSEELYDILCYPLMLTLYANASSYKEINGFHQALIWKDAPKHNGEIIWNFIETQLHKAVFLSSSQQKNVLDYLFAIEYVLPYIGYSMLIHERFDFSITEIKKSIMECIVFYQERWENHKYSERIETVAFLFDGNQIDYNPNQLFRILVKELHLLDIKGNKGFSFFHQHFRDCFAAIHLINVIIEGVCDSELSVWIEPQVLKYISELIEKDKVLELINKYRFQKFKKDDLLLSNILKVFSLMTDGDFTDFNFSGLDLTNISLRDYCVTGASFDEATIAPMTFMQRGHSDSICDMVLSKNGNSFYTCSLDGSIMMWSLCSASFLGVLKGHISSVKSILIYKDSLFSASYDKTILKWDVENATNEMFYCGKAPIEKIGVYADNIVGLRKDGRLLFFNQNIVVNIIDDVSVFDASNDIICYCQKGICNVQDRNGGRTYLFQIQEEISSLVVSKIDSFVFIGTFKGNIYCFNRNTKTITFVGNSGSSISRIIELERKQIVSAQSDGSIIVWDYLDCNCVKKMISHHRDVISLLYVKEKGILLSGSIDNSVKMWSVNNADVLHTIEGYTNWINWISHAKKADIIVSASGDGSLRIWDRNDYSTLAVYTDHEDWVYSCDISDDGSICASGDGSGTVIVRNILEKKILFKERICLEEIKMVSISGDGRYVAVCGNKGTVSVVDIATKRFVFLDKNEDPAYRIIISKDSRKVLVGFSCARVALYDIRKGQRVWCKQINSNKETTVRGLDVDSGFTKAIVGINEQIVYELDLRNGDIIKKYDFECSARIISYNSLSNLIAVADISGNVEVRDNNEKIVFKKKIHNGEIRTIHFINDHILLTGGSDSFIFITDLKEQVEKKITPFFLLKIQSCSFKKSVFIDEDLKRIIEENARTTIA